METRWWCQFFLHQGVSSLLGPSLDGPCGPISYFMASIWWCVAGLHSYLYIWALNGPFQNFPYQSSRYESLVWKMRLQRHSTHSVYFSWRNLSLVAGCSVPDWSPSVHPWTMITIIIVTITLIIVDGCSFSSSMSSMCVSILNSDPTVIQKNKQTSPYCYGPASKLDCYSCVKCGETFLMWNAGNEALCDCPRGGPDPADGTLKECFLITTQFLLPSWHSVACCQDRFTVVIRTLSIKYQTSIMIKTSGWSRYLKLPELLSSILQFVWGTRIIHSSSSSSSSFPNWNSIFF